MNEGHFLVVAAAAAALLRIVLHPPLIRRCHFVRCCFSSFTSSIFIFQHFHLHFKVLNLLLWYLGKGVWQATYAGLHTTWIHQTIRKRQNKTLLRVFRGLQIGSELYILIIPSCILSTYIYIL